MLFEGELCICCMSTEKLIDLYSNDNNLLIKYFNILESCLNIELVELRELDCYICKCCVMELKNLIEFKKKSLQNISKLTSKNITNFLSEKDCLIFNIEKNYVNKSIQNTLDDCSITLKEHPLLTPEELLSINSEDCPTITLKEFLTQSVEGSPKITIEEDATIESEELKKIKPKKGFFLKELKNEYKEDIRMEMPYKIDKSELKCRECHAEFCTYFKLKRHYTVHFKNYNCTKCTKSFTSAKSLANHQVSHLVRKYDCPDCNKIFKNRHSLNTHRRSKHSTELPFKCKQCGQQFPTYILHTVHLAKVHGNIKKYKCNTCDASFLHSYQLSKHTSRKHDDKTYSCKICGFTTQRELLQQHVKRMHSMQTGQKNKERRFICKLCSKGFSQKITFKTHINTCLRDEDYDGDWNDLLIIMDKKKKGHKGLLEGIISAEDNTLEELSEEEEEVMDFSDNIDDFILDDEQLYEIVERDLDVIDKCDN